MDTKALINETLKYLEKDANGNPKYRFEVYNTGASNYIKDQARALLNADLGANESEDKIPVSVYTVGDLFGTLSETGTDIIEDISALPGTLDNIKVSLKMFGFNTISSTIDIIKAAVIPIETLQTINEVYRVARPLVEKVVDVASIMFRFENAAKVAQDVLQYLGRIAVSAAKNYLEKLFNILMDMPVFAIYENDDAVNLSGAYSTLSEAANGLIDGMAQGAFKEIMKYANFSDTRTYEPKYNEIGVSVPDDIVDIFSDVNTRKIYVATEHKIYTVESDYSAKQIFETEDSIQNVFYFENYVYYITGSTVKKVSGNSVTTALSISGSTLSIINSSPVFIYSSSDKSLYKPNEQTAFLPIGDVQFHTYDAENNVTYFITKEGSDFKRLKMTQDKDGNYQIETFGPLSNIPYGIAYFDGSLYIVLKDDSGKYYMSKMVAGLSFDYTEYTVEGQSPSNGLFVWSGDSFTTDGNGIYAGPNGTMKYQTQASENINCVTKRNYNGNNYYVCSGGLNLYVTKIGSSYLWNTKRLNLTTTLKEDEHESIPDNVCGITWFSNAYGNFLLVNSQNHIYVYNNMSDIFDVVDPAAETPIKYKEFKSFSSWFTQSDTLIQDVDYSYKFDLKDSCVVTAIRVINGQLYIALYSPNYMSGSSVPKCGVYKASINNSSGRITIDYDHPVACSNIKVKIYSFDYINKCWYYTDGSSLYNATFASMVDLELEEKSDRAIYITTIDGKVVIYTAKAILTETSTETFTDIKSLVKYSSETLPQVASTRNTLLYSDGNCVYNMINNGEDDISADLFQICYHDSPLQFRLIQSCDAVFIVSKNTIKKIPLYSSLTSSNYGCGYYSDTTLNRWYGAAPYYFASNVLNERKNSEQRNIFLLNFRENFKVELTKLLKNIPDAFVKYTQESLTKQLKKLGVEIEGDDGQIVDLIIDSVSSTTANSMGMYIQNKFLEKIGDDETYETFATQVYNACVSDLTNNMTKDFYDIFEEFYNSIITEAIMEKNLGKSGLSNSLLRYYQNHKSEWAKSMTDLIDVDVVAQELYEIPLNTKYDVQLNTYRFDYENDTYKYEYIANPSAKFLKNNILSGYLHEGKFYSDKEYTTELDPRTKVDNDYLDAENNVICYGDGNGNFYTYKLQDYILTSDTEIDTSKDYYVKSGDDQYIYSLTEDTVPQENKPYFKNNYSLSTDEEAETGKTYYRKIGGEYDYELQTASILDTDKNYFVKNEYALTSDTEVDETKTYYTQGYAPASGDVVSGVQYYELSYVETQDTKVDSNKNYYEYLDLSGFVGETSYKYAPSSTETKYSLNYVLVDSGSLDLSETYYTLKDRIYTIAYEVNEQYGPYYKVDGFVQNDAGDYIQYIVQEGDSTYTLVANPTANNLPTYYELFYAPVTEIEKTDGKYVLEFSAVEDPNSFDLESYYEKDGSYIAASDLTYIYDNEGKIEGIKRDRELYAMSYLEEEYIDVQNPSSPVKNGYYEKNIYEQIISESSDNPKEDGLFERILNSIIFTKVETPVKSKLPTYYEYDYSYSTVYDDGKVYIDLAAVSFPGEFDTEDKNWHNDFYFSVLEAGERVTSEDLETARTQAITELNALPYIVTPSDVWQMLITKAVSEYYIPIQGDQFRQIVLDSNMYPIQWNELPDEIDHNSFDYALTALLYAIKQRLLTNITILVDGGKVKCYSCIDASTVIQKMINRNGVIWNNQIRMAKSRVSKATTVAEIKEAFSMVHAEDGSRYMLKNLLDKQSRLYSNYIDQIIEAQVINDNDTEVVM